MLRRLLPDPGPVSVADVVGGYSPGDAERSRPFVAVNFVESVDGQVTLGGRSGGLGSATDTALMVGLRSRFDAVLIGAGTMRAERYGDIGRPLIVVESENGERVDLPGLLKDQRDQGVGAILCEGGPTLFASLLELGAVDELFLTLSPKVVGLQGPRLVERALPRIVGLQLEELLEDDGELFARYAVES